MARYYTKREDLIISKTSLFTRTIELMLIYELITDAAPFNWMPFFVALLLHDHLEIF